VRVTRQTLQEHREAILNAASGLFRRRGIDNVSVADVTRAAGLTHGAFYGHFSSKTALASAACAESLANGAASWRARAARARDSGHEGLRAIIESYLSPRHRDAPESGCALAALGTELARGEPELRAALDGGVAALAAVLAEEIDIARPGLAPADRDRAALAVLAAMTGGIVLARAIADPARSRQALDAAIAASRAAAET